MSTPAERRPTEAAIDLDAIRHNASVLAALAAPAELCAVVKADGYGHGSVPAARAALDGGATWLAVALAEEAETLRNAGLEAPILLLTEPSLAAIRLTVDLGIEVAVYSAGAIEALSVAAAAAGRTVRCHLKVDTGMHRVGCHPDDARRFAELVTAAEHLELAAVWTHCACADEPATGVTERQLATYEKVLAELADAGVEVGMRHAANSAGLLAHPASRYDLCRAGIALYGIDPGPEVAGLADLQPAMSLRTEVAHVLRVPAGDGVSYGHRYRMPADGWVAVVPVGYADGVDRRLGDVGGEVLIGGRRHPIAGSVTMDQICVDCGDFQPQVGDEAVLIGRQADQEIRATDWAERLGTIAYETVCSIGSRVPRRHEPAPAEPSAVPPTC